MDHDEVMGVLRDPVSQRLLKSPRPARLAYLAADGSPRVVPVGYLWTGSALVTCTATEAAKVGSLTRDPRVALTIDTEAPPWNALFVRGTASIDIVDGIPDEYLAAAHKGLPEAQWTGFDVAVRALYPAMARISITPAWAKVLDFETRLPTAVERLMQQQQQ
jgi:hypothetical protein